MSLKDQLIKVGLVSQEEADQKEIQQKKDKQKQKEQKKNIIETPIKVQSSSYFFYKRKEKPCRCPLCFILLKDKRVVPQDVILVTSFYDLNKVISEDPNRDFKAKKIMKDHHDDVIEFSIKFSNGKVKVTICAECIANHFINEKYFVDPFKNDKTK